MTVAPILTAALRYGAVVAAAVAVLGSLVGFLVSGVPGVLGALVGAALSAVFLGLTAVSILLGGRAAKGDGTSPVFFGVVLGTFGLKLVLFLVFALWLRGQTWLDARLFAATAIVAVIGSLVADLVAYARTRVPYVSDVTLPGEGAEKP